MIDEQTVRDAKLLVQWTRDVRSLDANEEELAKYINTDLDIATDLGGEVVAFLVECITAVSNIVESVEELPLQHCWYILEKGIGRPRNNTKRNQSDTCLTGQLMKNW